MSPETGFLEAQVAVSEVHGCVAYAKRELQAVIFKTGGRPI